MMNINIENYLAKLHPRGVRFEIRILGARGGVVCGFFNNPATATAEVSELQDEPYSGCYVSLNEVSEAAFKRSPNKLTRPASRGMASSDSDVVRRRWLLIDLDPARIGMDSSYCTTGGEMQNALDAAGDIAYELWEAGWPEPIEVMSGNGAALLYRVDLPADDETDQLIKRLLAAMSRHFTTPAVDLDTSVFNRARISKVAGTVARKQQAPGRPWRRAWFDDDTHCGIEPVTLATLRGTLEQLPGEPPAPAKPKQLPSVRPSGQWLPGEDFDQRGEWEPLLLLAGWTRKHGDYWFRPGKTDGGHSGRLMQSADGAPIFHNFSENSPGLEPSKSYSRFEFFRQTFYGGDTSAAASKLSQLGYGSRRQSA